MSTEDPTTMPEHPAPAPGEEVAPSEEPAEEPAEEPTPEEEPEPAEESLPDKPPITEPMPSDEELEAQPEPASEEVPEGEILSPVEAEESDYADNRESEEGVNERSDESSEPAA